VIPAIVIVFGLIRIYSRPVTLMGIEILPPLTGASWTTNFLLIMGYAVLSLPYMYRAVDNGLRSMDVRTLTEAAQSLGANWIIIMFRIILPNLRAALLSGALLTVAIVIGELTLANFLARPAFGPYLALLGNSRAYEPAALAIVSFLLTWAVMVLIFFVTRGREGESQVVGAH
jgi:putative spermidine/putrescine transport system permease protein